MKNTPRVGLVSNFWGAVQKEAAFYLPSVFSAVVLTGESTDFVQSLPLGLKTLVGGNATRLSGGQCQRCAIARELIKNAPILILDEATSALDNESDRQVQASLET